MAPCAPARRCHSSPGCVRFSILVLLTGVLLSRTATAVPATAVVDPTSVILYLDEGRVEIDGDDLQGSRLRWQTAAGSGIDLCPIPKTCKNASVARSRCRVIYRATRA